MGNSSYFRFDDDNKTKYNILSIITKEMGKLKTGLPEGHQLSQWWFRTHMFPSVYELKSILGRKQIKNVNKRVYVKVRSHKN